jgi:hypothetical protein
LRININSITACLNLTNTKDTDSALTIIFPIIDKASRVKYPSISENKKRMIRFLNDIFNRIYLLRYSPNVHPLQNGNVLFVCKSGESVGETLYKLRCKLLHEAEPNFDIEFIDNIQYASYTDGLDRVKHQFGNDLPEMLLLASLVYVSGIQIRGDQKHTTLSIGERNFKIEEILGNTEKFKRLLHNRRYPAIRTPSGDISIILDNSFIGKGAISNNGPIIRG